MSLADEAELEQELDRVYGLPLGEFVAARDELAKRARAEGQRAIAARVKELRKPTVSAWVVNRLARDHELDVQRLLTAGERLEAAQRAAVAGRDAEAFREARVDEQRALERLAANARELLRREGHGSGVQERVLRTLRAAAGTAEGRERLQRGRLTEDVEPQGFEAFAGIVPTQPSRQPERKQPRGGDRTEQRRAVEEARRRLRDMKKRAAELARDASAADQEARQAERRAQDLRGEAEQARAEADAAAESVADAERELEELTKKVGVHE
jgi:hypothetical protein